MSKKSMRYAVVSLFVLVLAGTWAASYARSQPERSPANSPLPVATLQVEPVEQYQMTRVYTGTVVAARTSQLSLQRGGEITAIHVDQGERVERGQLLAELNTNSLQAHRRELGARRAAAQAVLDELLAGARPETIAAARAEVRNLEAQVKLQELTLQRRKNLIDQRAVSQADYDQAQYGLQSATALLEAAQERLAELEAGPRKEKKLAQRAEVEQLDAAIAAVDVDLENSRLVAPFCGTVSGRLLDEGAVISPGQVVLRLIEDRRLEAWFGLPVAVADQISSDAPGRLTVNGRKLHGTVKAVLPEVDAATRTRRVVMQLPDDAASHVYAGEIVRWELSSEVATEPGYWLPTTALVRGGRGMWSCFAVVADRSDAGSPAPFRIEKRDVRVIHTAGERVLVRGMLQPGDQLVAAGVHRVAPGQAVKVASQL